MKEKGKFMKIFTEMLKVGPGFERLFFFGLLSIILCHIVACLWILLPQFVSHSNDEENIYTETWIE